MTGRGRGAVAEDARLLGQTSYIFEAGACVVLDGEEHWLTGELQPGDACRSTTRSSDRRARAAARALRAGGSSTTTRGTQAARSRICFRGLVDAFEADALLRRARPRRPAPGRQRRASHRRSAGARRPAAGARLPPGPEAASKAGGVAAHLRARGYERAECFAVGDSREDLGRGRSVGAFWLVANARREGPDDPRGDRAAPPTCASPRARYGAGVYEAVITTLAERRG